MELDDHLRQMLKALGQAINESISGSESVNESIQRIRDEGYELYMVLDAKVGLDHLSSSHGDDDEELGDETVETPQTSFRINIGDVRFLQSMGIDPTRKVRTVRRRTRASSRVAPARRASSRGRKA
jgi:hypothetical protein